MSATTDAPIWITKTEAARLLSVSTKHIDRLIASGELRRMKTGTAVRVERISVIEHGERNRA